MGDFGVTVVQSVDEDVVVQERRDAGDQTISQHSPGTQQGIVAGHSKVLGHLAARLNDASDEVWQAPDFDEPDPRSGVRN
jgi:hypothetical protein